MARISDTIENFIKDMLNEERERQVLIQRNELADKFSCAPSQINYVLTTRFTYEKGYIIESKRGGNGFIKIITIVEEDDYISYLIKNLNEQMTEASADILFMDLYKKKYFTRDEFLMAKYATSDKALSMIEAKSRNYLRSAIIKNILLSVLARS